MTTFYAPLTEVNALIDIDASQYQQLNIEVSDLRDMDLVRDLLSEYLSEAASIKVEEEEDSGPMGMMAMMMGGMAEVVDEPWEGTQFDVTNLNDAMSNVMSLVDILQLSSNAVFAVILLIIMVGITNSYRMVILERVEEIGTMRAMGAQRNWVFNLFISESVMIAALGSAAGVLASLGLMGVIGSIEFASDSGPIQLFSIANHLQFPVSVGTFVGPVIITLLIAALAVYLPAKTAAKMAPGDALRATA
jgi:putative ABC transport system permease protein